MKIHTDINKLNTITIENYSYIQINILKIKIEENVAYKNHKQ